MTRKLVGMYVAIKQIEHIFTSMTLTPYASDTITATGLKLMLNAAPMLAASV